ncbi:uncharacterized protein LOC141903694 [Tubulanus polymorphus]|uniref:uncharacterized protein LOC141903694 n=1 Tax=Tubulanus polymorphus TaxID=672921 RepID=UPI003DA33E05
MSRGVRDLRELICVSRLTYRNSDDEADLSDISDALSLSGDAFSGSSGRESSNSSVLHCDSGISTNGERVSPESVGHAIGAARDFNGAKNPKSKSKTKRKKKKKKPPTVNVPVGHEFPKPEALPPVRSSSARSESSSDSASALKPCENEHDFDGNFDYMFQYIDATLLGELLPKANESVSDLSLWCHHGDNFIEFAHFLMTDFPALKWQEILQLEHSILIDELSLLFAAGRDSGTVRYGDLMKLIGAVLREYPAKLFSSRGSFLFLNYLDVLSSERADSYKRLLTDVKIRTTNRMQAQWALAIRAYALANIWYAVVTFYRRLSSSKPEDFLKKLNLQILKEDMSQRRLYQAIKRGFVDVVNYFIKSGKIDPRIQDEHQRSLIFIAVMHNQDKVLKFLLTQVKPKIDPEAPADSGNTPLHAAANSGSASMVRTLLNFGRVDVNKVNKHCDNATALHMAVLHGHKDVVEVLLSVGADQSMKMDGLTAADIARDFHHEDIVELFGVSDSPRE